MLKSSPNVSWVHLSDLHYNPALHWNASELLKELAADVSAAVKRCENPPRLLFFTGDLADGHGDSVEFAKQYDGVWNVVSSVIVASGSQIQPQNIYFVPGNHDVNRTRANRSIQNLVTSLPDGEIDNLVACRTQSDAAEWQNVVRRLDDYKAFLAKHNLKHLLQDADRLIYAHQLDIEGLKLGIAGINTAWSCCKDSKAENGQLRLGAGFQTGELHRRLTSESHHCDIRIALMHHPCPWFVEEERISLDQHLRKNYHLVLHGHEHTRDVLKYEGHLRVSSPVLNEFKNRRSGYSVGQAVGGEDPFVKIWFRRFDTSTKKFSPDVNSDTDNEGCLTHYLRRKSNTPSRGKISMSRDLSGSWDTTYDLAGKKRGGAGQWPKLANVVMSSKHDDVAKQEFHGDGDGILPSPHKFILSGEVKNTNWFVGTWETKRKGGVYHGSFVLHINIEGTKMEGKWLGNDEDNRVQHGNWTWTRKA